MLALTASMLAFAPAFRSRGEDGYGRLSFVCGVVAVCMLLVGLALLPTDFAWWGLWERGLLAIMLG